MLGDDEVTTEDVVKVEFPDDDLIADNEEPDPLSTEGVASGGGEKSDRDDPDEDVDEEEAYEVEKILDERSRKGCTEYLIQWKGFGPENNTWEPEDNLSCDEIIEDFKAKKKKKGSPSKKRKAPEVPGSSKKGKVKEEIKESPKKRELAEVPVAEKKPKASSKVTKKEETEESPRKREASRRSVNVSKVPENVPPLEEGDDDDM